MKLSHKNFIDNIIACVPELKDNEILLNSNSKKELYNALKINSDKLGELWVNSKRTDFSIYSTTDYLLECIWCFFVSSNNSIWALNNYFKKNNIDLSEYSIIDIFNGLGFTTEKLLQSNFKQVYTFNNVDHQISCCEKWCSLHSDNKNINFYEFPKDEKFDVVLCLETFEHFEDPFDFIKSCMDLSTNYLIETASFSSPSCYGHFEKYKYDTTILTGRQTQRLAKQIINEEFELVYKGFNSLPRIWKRRKKINGIITF
jgi:hypothetical protein